MKTHYILIDFENVQVKSLALLKGDHFRVKVFLGPKNTKLPTGLVLAMKDLGERADYIVLEAGGNNALDFHIAYYLGVLAAADAAGMFYVISKDTGFDPLLKHLKKHGVQCERAVAIEEMRCFAQSIEKPKVVAKPSTNKPSTKKTADELLDLVVANLQKRATARPRTEKTLRSTVKTLCGTQYSDKELDAVMARLLKKGHICVSDGKVTYPLL
jgi:hypothetical protein